MVRPGYKQTEVGVIPEDWDAVPFSRFVAIQRGHDLTAQQRRRGDVPVMGSAGQNGFHDTALKAGPGVVIGRSGASYGQAHWCETDFWPHNTALYVTDFFDNDPRFAFYLLRATDFSQHNSGGAQQSLNRNFIADVMLARPQKNEQVQIRKCLDDVDAALAGVLRLIAKKKDLKQAAMQTLLTGQTRLPDFAGDWEVKRLGDVAHLHKGQVIPYLRPSETFEHYSLPAFDEFQNPIFEAGVDIRSNKFTVPPNAILVSKLNPRIPRVWVPKVLSENAVASTEFLVLRPKDAVVREYLAVVCLSASFCEKLESAATGTTGSHQRVGPETAMKLQILWPTDVDEQTALANVAKDMDAEIAALTAQADKIRLLKQAMMQDLLTSRVRLPLAEVTDA